MSENSAKYLSQVSCNVGHWVCSHPSRIAFSVRCLSSLLPFGVSLRSVFCDYGFAHTRVPLRFLSRFCRFCFYPRCALQCNTLGLFRPVSLGIFSAHSVGFVLTRDSVRCSVKRLWVWSHPCLFALSVQVLHWVCSQPCTLVFPVQGSQWVCFHRCLFPRGCQIVFKVTIIIN